MCIVSRYGYIKQVEALSWNLFESIRLAAWLKADTRISNRITQHSIQIDKDLYHLSIDRDHHISHLSHARLDIM